MQRRVEEADARRFSRQSAEDALEVRLLIRQQFCQSCGAAFFRSREDHFTHRVNAIALEEHMLRAAETDALGTERNGIFNLFRSVRVGTDAQLAELVRQLHHKVVVLEELAFGRLHRLADEDLLKLAVRRGDRSVEHLACRAVDADGITFADRRTVAGQRAVNVVDVNITRAGHAHLAHLTSDQSRMARHAAATGQDALGCDHSAEIFRACLHTRQHDTLALAGKLLRLGGSKYEGA